MELLLNVFLTASALACLGAVIITTVSIRREASFQLSMANETEDEIKRIIRAFVPSGANDNSGRLFADLVEIGYFTSLRMGNHGKRFNYNRQLRDSQKFLTLEISAALKKVGENYERYYV